MEDDSTAGTRRGSRSRILIIAAAGMAALAVLAIATLGNGTNPRRDNRAVIPAEPPAADTATPQASPRLSTASPIPRWEGPTVPPIDESLAQGSASAPVTIVEFGDFKCSECGTFARRIEPALRRRYIDTGIVRLFWRDFPAQGKESERAAIAARAADRQNAFWPFHDALYAEQSSGFTDDRLRAVAARVGLDVARFDADRRDPELRRAVEQDFAFAAQLGLPGTPAFLINGELFFGAQPLSKFVEAIEEARHG
ncbi:protein-disulfide isomerase [Nonomuraea polychroma]|uniref:Protein-disulfide isomerase n=1 Tax=Nonomuraea polychroma TaxID=46176 RepID=A0A438M6R3_9ACTN|nr:thioredoxin domain-containing protein [Nonomuraea polychroma]RVX41401.1 protein-disulfide isomerase [Nonomuraea polychroma]